ncbi:excinuclease ABC subunit UvrA [Candidatus Gottesmanbacteria bacterium]|nr:excinuclease ABC subunit UvrA [Candidatus Gottesmanbacteria bacterium]
MENIIIRGARQHNLKNVNLTLPKNKLIIFTGLSGSGKSSLAFDTIYAEGQRRYVESLSSYARQFLGVMDKPDMDSIDGLSPAISIDQKSTSHNPRSTVGTVTEIYDYLRLLFARIGHPHCPTCGREISRQTPGQITEHILRLIKRPHTKLLILAPVVRDRKGEFSGLLDNLMAKGFRQVRVDGRFFGSDDDIVLIKTNKHSIDAVVDRLMLTPKQAGDPTVGLRISESVEQALTLSDGLVTAGEVLDTAFAIPEKPKKVVDHVYSEKFSCPHCNISLSEIEPRSFSFNSPHGACPNCSGLGKILTVDPDLMLRPELSITEGGILPFARMFFHDTWFSRVITTVASAHGIDPRAPLKMLTKHQMKVLLEGTQDRQYLVHGTNRFGDKTTIEEQFHGLTAELKRRYIESESESDAARSEIEKYMREETCPLCTGRRLKKETLTITVDGFSIADIADLSIQDCLTWIHGLPQKLTNATEYTIAQPIQKEIYARLNFLSAVGLNYLTLSRSATTLSGGEAQRIRLASQIGSGLTGVLYVLDEPSIGLHQKDNTMLINTLKKLRDLGNTVIVVEHDRETMEAADWIVDFGPGAGEHGGMVVAEGTLENLKKSHTVTAQFLTGARTITRQKWNEHTHASGYSSSLVIAGASENNLKNVTAEFPLGKLICITGVSGSGKSTLIVETLYRALFAHFNPFTKEKPGIHTEVRGLEHVDKVILIDQSPIGRTPRSNPATYTGIFSLIRDLFAATPEARVRGYKPGRFSFNVKGGRCEACEGEGQKKIEMQFLSDIYVTCEVCHGSRYNTDTLEVSFRGKNIAQILNMTIEEAIEFFANQFLLHDKLATIAQVGLTYMHLGQSATTLSGGEAQRVKLATELSRRGTGKTVYILDEPTTGLHFADLEKLLAVLHQLTIKGNTVIVIEHNLDMIKNADWIIDLGPDGGDAGGRIIAEGTPEHIAHCKQSYTGQYLRKVLQ